MQKLIFALEKTVFLLKSSEDSIWSNQTAVEAKAILEKELDKLKKTGKFSFFGKSKIKLLFVPTGALQEISIDNGWGNEYLQISEVVDEFIN